MNPEQHPHQQYHTAPPLPGTEPESPHAAAPERKKLPYGDEQRHLQSKVKYPELALSAGEYVIEVVNRHPIGLLSIWLITGLLIVLAVGGVPLYGANLATIADVLNFRQSQLPDPAILAVPALILAGFFALGGIVATIVYNGNRFYLTNESVIQHVQFSLFSTKQQVVNLINVEDASSTQKHILEQILNYGTIRLSTQGEETIYEFHYVADPKRVVNVIHTATENAVRSIEGIPPSEY